MATILMVDDEEVFRTVGRSGQADRFFGDYDIRRCYPAEKC